MKKMKVLLVDDEPLVSEIILSLLDWEEEGFYYPRVAFNGRDALKMYEQEQADIIITDIYMPVIDGIEFCKKILKQNSQANIIILTVSEKFECVKEALELGVFSYLLKHELSTESLRKNLEGIRRKIKQEEKLKRAILQSFLYELFCQSTINMEEIRNYDYSKENIKLSFLLIQPGEEFQIQTEIRREKREVGEKLQVKLELSFPSLYLIRYEHKYIVAAMDKTLEGLEEVKKFGAVFTEELKEQDTYALFLFCQFCGVKEVRHILSDMEHALENQVFLKKNCMLEKRDFLISNGNILAVTDRHLKGLKELFFDPTNNKEEILKIIQELFEDIRRNLDLKSLSKACRYLNENLELGKKRMNLQSELLEEKVCWYDIDRIQEKFVEMWERVCSLQEETSVMSKRTKEILKYIQEHYAEDLSADSVADAFGISSVYLHQQFKKEVGDTFLNYVMSVRMEHAKILLKHSTYKINTIAEKVGYHSSQYFSQIFRKNVGCTPIEYREMR